MACSIAKFMWNFVVYCEKFEDTEELACVAQRESRLAHKVVLDLATDV